jgi:hypothetical protein
MKKQDDAIAYIEPKRRTKLVSKSLRKNRKMLCPKLQIDGTYPTNGGNSYR